MNLIVKFICLVILFCAGFYCALDTHDPIDGILDFTIGLYLGGLIFGKESEVF